MQQSTQQQVQPQFTFEGGHLVMFHQEATGLPAVVDSNVNDRDRTLDLLATEKYLTHGYHVAMTEASHDQLFQVFKQNHDASMQIQRQLFNTAFKKGWYRLPVADAQAVSAALTHHQKHMPEFPYPQGQATTQRFSQSQQQSSQQQGQQMSQQQATTASRTAGATASDQQLNRKVEQAIQQAQSGHVPGNVQAPVGGRVSH